MDNVLGEFEQTALMGCKAVREFLTYSGDNKAYLNRAKAGAVAMGSYARLRATMANEAQIRLLEGRSYGRQAMSLLPTSVPDDETAATVLREAMP